MEKKIKVEIVGESPLLMHRMNPDALVKGIKKKSIPTPEDEAKSSAYISKKGILYVPSVCLHRTIWNASKIYKVGGKSIAPFIMGSMRIEPIEISLGTKKYEVDVQPAVVQRSRVLRARARIDDWKISFEIYYISSDFPENFPEMIKQIINDAGHRIGLLDFRPMCGGTFGRFHISKFEA